MVRGLADITGAQGRAIAAAMREVAEVDGVDEAETDLIRRFEEGLGSKVEDGASLLSVIDTDSLRTAYTKSMIIVAFADGKLTEKERTLVEQRATEVGVSAAELTRIYTMVARDLLGALSGLEIDRNQAVEIGRSLGLSDEEIERVLQ
jgi:uncharacterized tellurite resistance protein B-like protein